MTNKLKIKDRTKIKINITLKTYWLDIVFKEKYEMINPFDLLQLWYHLCSFLFLYIFGNVYNISVVIFTGFSIRQKSFKNGQLFSSKLLFGLSNKGKRLLNLRLSGGERKRGKLKPSNASLSSDTE